ncbi:glycoside hydrolase family 2 protein [Chelatococcus daeguensis]|nr:glycoside hydrolase family 2 TIM barrel-domain containing protein [Chelatococcus daeguensis]
MSAQDEMDGPGQIDPYHHLHDEAYERRFAKGYVGWRDMVFMGGRAAESLDGEWRFAIDPYDEGLRQKWYADAPAPVEAWPVPRDYDTNAEVTAPVPSCWNVLRREWTYLEGAAWYTRFFTHRTGADERIVLRVGAANYEARVFLNGIFVGAHRGGSTPFFIELTGHLVDGENRLQIQVDNRRRPDRVPMQHTDWFNYGGLYREVSLVRLPPVFIRDFGAALVPGSGGRRLRFDVTLSDPVDGTATIAVDGLIDALALPVSGGFGSIEVEASPALWSPDTPRLYAVTVRCGHDEIGDRVGFREISVDGRRILLNGEPIFLRGICVHEDDVALGKTTSEADLVRRFDHARALNCNFLRLAHYPHHERAAELADELGFLLWEEIPVYWAIAFEAADTFADADNQLREMVRRDRNRASVIIWGIGNENADTDPRHAFMSRLAATAREADGTRLVSAACLINRAHFRIEDRLAAHLDVIGLNEYFGWYEPSMEGLERLLANSDPDRPVIITETGADAVAGLRGPATTFFTEDCQEAVYRAQLTTLARAGYVQGVCPWILYDFRTERRQTVFQRGYNRKGLVAEDKTTRKRAFDVLAACWAERRRAENGGAGGQAPLATTNQGAS